MIEFMIGLRRAKSEREGTYMKSPIANKIAPELVEKIREKYSLKDIEPKSRPVRVVKKSSGKGKSKDQDDAEGKD